MTNGDEDIVIGTKDGMLIKFKETDIRSMGRIAGGVRGIRLREGDIAVGMDVVERRQRNSCRHRKRFWKTNTTRRISYPSHAVGMD